MDLTTNGYVANGVYDNIRGMGNYGTAFDMDAHVYEQSQGIKDQNTLINLYQDNKAERRNDKVDMKICDVEKDTIRQTAAVMHELATAEKEGITQTTGILQKISECCCESRVAITALNGKVDLNAALAKSDLSAVEARLSAQAAAINLANVERMYAIEREDNNFNKRCLFPVAGSCSK